MKGFSRFPMVDALMAEDRMTRERLCDALSIKYKTLQNKLNGKTEFTRSEMFAIQGTFSRKVPLDILFSADMREGTA